MRKIGSRLDFVAQLCLNFLNAQPMEQCKSTNNMFQHSVSVLATI